MKRLLFVCLALVLLDRVALADDYWQQHVSYKIEASLDDPKHTLAGTLSVVYSNNSPDTLRDVYFHLYMNAFQPGSMMDIHSRTIHSSPVRERIAILPSDEQGLYTISSITADGQTQTFEITGTIMRVHLSQPLLPGRSVTLAMPFVEQIARQTRRNGWMSREGVKYSMAQWYPKVAEYDREGWQIQEYVGREFYGVWGEFDVKLTLPGDFTVGATGQCINPDEVGHGYDRIAHGEKEGLELPKAASDTKTWHFTASNVHDFAWVADDKYVHEWTTWRDTITVHAFYKQQVSGLWQNALKYTVHALRTYDSIYGPYPYRNFSNTMAGDGGMEYPQLIMITGYRGESSLAGVTAHEVAHQWFYGLLGSNESREAFMDEGFTSYATTQAMNLLWGRYQVIPGTERSWLDWFVPQFDNKSDNYRGYQSLAAAGYEEPLTIPHDWFREDVTAGQVYGKTQAILSMLEYTLGDTVFAHGMREYYQRWHFKHPYLRDFRRTMEDVSGTDLDWFFDQWFSTARTLDYAAQCASSEKVSEGSYKTTLWLSNKNEAVMPMDLLLHYSDGTTEAANIPLATNLGAGYRKPEPRIFFPEWPWVTRAYEGTATTPKPVSWFEIDTSLRLQDLDRSNNIPLTPSALLDKVHFAVWKQYFSNPPMDAPYHVFRPIAWYQDRGGLNIGIGDKFGINLHEAGNHRLVYKTESLPIILHGLEDSGASVRRALTHFDYVMRANRNVNWLGRLTKLNIDVANLDGIFTTGFQLEKTLRPEFYYLGPVHVLTFGVESNDRWTEAAPYNHAFWSSNTIRTANGGWRFVSSEGSTRTDASLETSLWNSDHAFSRLKLSVNQALPLTSWLGATIHFFGGTSTGNVPAERLYQLGMASPIDEQKNDLWRAWTSVDSGIDRSARFFLQGGAGVRAFAAAGSDSTALSNMAAVAGKHALGINLDIALPNPLSFLGSFGDQFGFGAFFDAGWTSMGSPQFFSDISKRLATDAGATVSIAALNWLPSQLRGVVEEYAPIPTIKVHFPVYVNHPMDGGDSLAFRWRVSLGFGG